MRENEDDDILTHRYNEYFTEASSITRRKVMSRSSQWRIRVVWVLELAGKNIPNQIWYLPIPSSSNLRTELSFTDFVDLLITYTFTTFMYLMCWVLFSQCSWPRAPITIINGTGSKADRNTYMPGCLTLNPPRAHVRQLSSTISCLFSVVAVRYCYHFLTVKGTVPRDFSPQLFFMKHISLGPWLTP